MTLEDEIAAMEDLLEQLEFVQEGDYVLARHPNFFADFLPHAYEAVKELYRKYVEKTGETDSDIEHWLAMAEARLKMIQRVKWGDLVLTVHHNALVDVFKPLEMVLLRLEERLG